MEPINVRRPYRQILSLTGRPCKCANTSLHKCSAKREIGTVLTFAGNSTCYSCKALAEPHNVTPTDNEISTDNMLQIY